MYWFHRGKGPEFVVPTEKLMEKLLRCQCLVRQERPVFPLRVAPAVEAIMIAGAVVLLPDRHLPVHN